MKLFLASLACQSLDHVRDLLPDDPHNLTCVVIPTASDTYDSHPWVEDDRAKLVQMGFQLTDYDIAGKDEKTLRHDLNKFNCVFVAGGNSFYLLHHSRKSGFDQVLGELLSKDVVYIGSSAGSVIMGPSLDHVVTLDHPELVPELTDYTGLGYIDERIIPHYGRDKYRERHDRIKSEWGDQVMVLTDDQALVINGPEKFIL